MTATSSFETDAPSPPRARAEGGVPGGGHPPDPAALRRFDASGGGSAGGDGGYAAFEDSSLALHTELLDRRVNGALSRGGSGALQLVRDASAPTDAEVEAFRNDPTVRAVLGDDPLLQDDDAVRALMVTLASVSEDPSVADADNSTLALFGLDGEEARSLAGTDVIGGIATRSSATAEGYAREADDYLARNPDAEVRAGWVRNEDGETEYRVEIVNPAATTPEERAELDRVNAGLEEVSSQVQHHPTLVTAVTQSNRWTVQFLSRARATAGELESAAEPAGSGERGRAGRSAGAAPSPEPVGEPVAAEPAAGADAATARPVDMPVGA